MSGQALWADDALWVGGAMVQRLRDQAGPVLRQVIQLDELDASGEPKQYPAAVIVFAGMRPSAVVGSAAFPRVTTVQQDWIVALAVQSARADQARDTKALGPLIPLVVGALHGWVPPGQQRALAWGPGPRPKYGPNTSFMPLLFSIQVTTA